MPEGRITSGNVCKLGYWILRDRGRQSQLSPYFETNSAATSNHYIWISQFRGSLALSAMIDIWKYITITHIDEGHDIFAGDPSARKVIIVNVVRQDISMKTLGLLSWRGYLDSLLMRLLFARYNKTWPRKRMSHSNRMSESHEERASR